MSDTLNDTAPRVPLGDWHDRRVNIGYETAEELVKHAHPLNWRGHPESQASATNDALDSLGWIDEIKVNVNTGNVFNGHLRISLALAKDPAMRLPVDYYDLSPDEEALALQVLDVTTEMAEPIPDKLAALLSRTRVLTADKPGLKAMLESLKQKAGINGTNGKEKDVQPQEDKAKELAEHWGTKTGQLWQLGEHRLIVGDCTDRAVVEAVTNGERADLVFTSPPYNRGTTTGGGFPSRGGMWQGAELAKGYTTHSDDMPVEKYRDWQKELLLSWWGLLSQDGAIYYNHRPRVQDGLLETPLDWNPDLPVRQIVIWHSGAGVNFAPTHYRPACEWIVIFAKPQFRLKDKSVSGVGDVWQFGAEQSPSHPAPFPVELPLTAIETTGADIILEPFSGSGTVIIAGTNLGRKVRAIEIDPGYAAVSIQRWVDLTGLTPKRIS